jgi:Zn-dependent M16 (insulinase) family peptidase
MELNKIEEGFDWIRKLLWNTQWTSERMKVIAKKMAGDVSQLKRKGTRMTSTVLKDVLYKTDSNVKATSLIRQHKFLKDLAASLPRGEKKLKEMFESIRKVITSPENMTIHIAASLGKLETKAAELPTKTVGGLLAKTFQFPEQIECEKRYLTDHASDSCFARIPIATHNSFAFYFSESLIRRTLFG